MVLWTMGRARVLGAHMLYVLCVLCVANANVPNINYCQKLAALKLENGQGRGIPYRALTQDGEPRTLKLCANDAAPVAARAILHALLVYGLRYREEDIEHIECSLKELQTLKNSYTNNYFVLSMASAWSSEGASVAQCAEGACGLAGSRLDVIGRGAAPVRRLLARLAPWAPSDCLQDWERLRSPECGFIDDLLYHNSPCSDWPNITCSGKCVTVAVTDEYVTEQCRLARKLSTEMQVQLAPVSELTNRSYLFFDYDIWIDDKERVRPASPVPGHAAPDAVSLSLGDVKQLLWYAPYLLNLAIHFQPPPPMLRRVLTNSTKLKIDQAACEAIVASEESRDLARKWLMCNETFCDLRPSVRIYVCEKEDIRDNRYLTIKRIVQSHWYNTTHQTGGLINLVMVDVNCSKTDEVKGDLDDLMTVYELRSSLRGVVAMGAAAASTLPELTSGEAKTPLVLVASPPSGVELKGARSTAPSVPALAASVQALLASCGWRRLALLREEGRGHTWQRSLGLAEALSKHGLVIYQEVFQADNVSSALDALQARDARVVLTDASAGTAKDVLAKAEERGLTLQAGYVWLVIGAAGNSSDSDWLPTNSQFSYLTVSGGWRGGLAPSGLHGLPSLRDALDKKFQRWPPHASSLVDALLLMLEGTSRLEKLFPQHRSDPHRPDVVRTFFEILDNITVPGVTRDIRANTTPPVFAHRWTLHGATLVGAWNGLDNIYLDEDPLCGGVLDGPGCYTTRSGDPFTPHCHDIAWAILLCALSFGLPSLYAARVARRRRLLRRDRAIEERALLRGGHSAAEAAAGAALAEYAVPRDSLQLLDELGTGHYGVVHQAVLRRPTSAALGVAVKAPRADAPVGAAAELLREAALLSTLRHDHIVRFTGVCWEGGPLVLMEHAFYGDLRRYLRARRLLAERARAGAADAEAAHVAASALTRHAREAAAALGYLAQQRLVHRDVRAANCLVDVRRCLKLADFGMARRLDKAGEGEEYLCKRRAMFPVLWMAPESLSRGVFSAASDVWALGVLFLELATLGERPYGAWDTPRVLRHVREGGAPPLPRDMASSTRGITATCWRRSPEERPTAAELVAYLAEHPRAIQPALAPHADAANVTPDTELYIDEWAVNRYAPKESSPVAELVSCGHPSTTQSALERNADADVTPDIDEWAVNTYAPEQSTPVAELVSCLTEHPSTTQSALEPNADADVTPDIDEWAVNRYAPEDSTPVAELVSCLTEHASTTQSALKPNADADVTPDIDEWAVDRYAPEERKPVAELVSCLTEHSRGTQTALKPHADADFVPDIDLYVDEWIVS